MYTKEQFINRLLILSIFLTLGSFSASVLITARRNSLENTEIDTFIDSCDNYNNVQKILLKRIQREHRKLFKSARINIHDFSCKEQTNDSST